MVDRRADKPEKERVRTVGTALEFRMELYAYAEGAARDFYRFNEPAVRRSAGNFQPGSLKLSAVFVVEFISVAVTLMYQLSAVAFFHLGAGNDVAGVAAETQCAAFVYFIVLTGHEIYNAVG